MIENNSLNRKADQRDLNKLRKGDLVDLIHEYEKKIDVKNAILEKNNSELGFYKEIFRDTSANVIVESFLQSIPAKKNYSSLRLVCIKEDSVQENSSQGIGRYSQAYQYLDDQIYSLLGKNRQLIINDIKRIRRIKFLPDHRIPASIIAFHVFIENDRSFFLWISFEQPDYLEIQPIHEIQNFIQERSAALKEIFFLLRQYEHAKILGNMFDLVSDPLMVCDDKYNLILKNPGMERVMHASKETGDSEFLNHLKPVMRKIEKNASDSGQIRWKENDYEYRINTMKSVEKEHKHWFIQLKDINARKRKESFFSEIFRSISRQFKSSLVKIKGAAAMVGSIGNLNDAQKKYAEEIIMECNVLDNLIRELLSFKRSNGESIIELSDININSSIQKLLKYLRPLIRQKSIRVIGEGIPFHLMSDLKLFEQVIFNILKFSIENSPLGGEISLECKQEKNFLEIVIIDQTKNISVFDMAMINENKKSKPEYQELNSAKKIASFMGGDILIYPVSNSGVKYIFRNKLEETN